MDFTDADVPPANMKDWHTCLKAKQISRLFFKAASSAAHSVIASFLFVLYQNTSLFEGPTRLLYFYMYVCIYVHILYKCHALGTVLCLFTEKGFVDFLSQLWAAHSFTSAVFLCFSSTCVCHLVSFYTSASVLIPFLSDNLF